MEYKISVIIPTYNRGHLISETIESVVSQNVDLECLVVDDGSTDNTEAIVKNYSDKFSFIKFIKRPVASKKGANTCRNYGLSLSKGIYIKWLDSDDLLAKGCLKIQLQQIETTLSDVDFCKARFFTSNSVDKIQLQDQLWCKRLFTENINRDLILGKLRWQTACGLWRKSFFKKEPFNDKLQNSQEWLFHIEQSFRKGIKYSFTEDALILVRKESSSMSHRSNKDGDYYYSFALARYLALKFIKDESQLKREQFFLLKKYFRYIVFTAYKGSPLAAIKLLKNIPDMLRIIVHK